MATAELPPLAIYAANLGSQTDIPSQFVWPEEDRPDSDAYEELSLSYIDLGRFLSGDPDATAEVLRQVADACELHGFFLVSNHGVDPSLIAAAHRCFDDFFPLPLAEKQRAQRKLGKSCGYASSFIGRFSSNLPWKETLSLCHCSSPLAAGQVLNYIVGTLGEDFRQFGMVLQEYCDAMIKLSSTIMEALGLSLGIERYQFRDFFEGSDSIMRLNHYPQCQMPDLALGTGPHCDPTSLTILHQNEVVGLQVFTDGRWRSVNPDPNAFIVNIGDTLTALTNGRYKSCLHRAVVNKEAARRTLTFFLSPEMEKVVRPPGGLVDSEHPRAYPDFTWAKLLEFTQNHHRADRNTLHAFSDWLLKNEKINEP